MTSFGISAAADTIMGAGSLQSWSATVLGSPASPTYGGPYWNNPSGDGNIGWCLTGSPACPIANPPGAISYFGNGTSAVSNRSAIFSPGGNYGFFIENVKSLGAPFEADYFWFMNSAVDSTGEPRSIRQIASALRSFGR